MDEADNYRFLIHISRWKKDDFSTAIWGRPLPRRDARFSPAQLLLLLQWLTLHSMLRCEGAAVRRDPVAFSSSPGGTAATTPGSTRRCHLLPGASLWCTMSLGTGRRPRPRPWTAFRGLPLFLSLFLHSLLAAPIRTEYQASVRASKRKHGDVVDDRSRFMAISVCNFVKGNSPL